MPPEMCRAASEMFDTWLIRISGSFNGADFCCGAAEAQATRSIRAKIRVTLRAKGLNRRAVRILRSFVAPLLRMTRLRASFDVLQHLFGGRCVFAVGIELEVLLQIRLCVGVLLRADQEHAKLVVRGGEFVVR